MRLGSPHASGCLKGKTGPAHTGPDVPLSSQLLLPMSSLTRLDSIYRWQSRLCWQPESPWLKARRSLLEPDRCLVQEAGNWLSLEDSTTSVLPEAKDSPRNVDHACRVVWVCLG